MAASIVRLYLFAEGKTEQTFADVVLGPHLANFGVMLQHAVEIAHSRKGGKAHRGGGRKYQPMRDDIARFLAQEKGPGVFFTSMIDLYALAPDFPGLDESQRFADPYDRVEFLEQQWKADLGDDRFLPFLQLHEFEAYLFVDPNKFSYLGGDRRKEIAALQAVADQFGNPERINDGQHTAPSKRIIDVFPEYKRGKTTIGPPVAKSIGLPKIRGQCRHFDEWLSRLEALP